MSDGSRFTDLLDRAARGEREARDAVLGSIQTELREMARREVNRHGQGWVMRPTTLVQELQTRWLEREELARIGVAGRRFFFASAIRAMKDILVDEVRRRVSAKRGGGARLAPLSEAIEVPGSRRSTSVVALHEALAELEALDPLQARIVHLKFFVGASNTETAELLDSNVAKVRREWAMAKGWLMHRLSPAE